MQKPYYNHPKFKLYQASCCFLAKASSDKNTPNFTDEEKSSGFEISWDKSKEALRLLNLKRTSGYKGKFIEESDFCFLNKARGNRGVKIR